MFLTIAGWIAAGFAVLAILYMISFFFRLGRTEKTIKRAVELGTKHLEHPPLTPEEQKEVDEFCRRGILEKIQFETQDGSLTTLYQPSSDPVLAELST